MLFSGTKMGHFGQIISGGFLGEVVVNQLTPPTPDQVQAWGSVVIQVLVGIVTIWATIRKALQQPQAVVPVPAVVPVVETSALVVPPVTAGPDGAVQ